jgi:hypothetical protein
MIVRTSAWLAALAFGLMVVALPTDTRADDKVNVSGAWTWSFTRANGGEPIAVTVTLKQEGEALIGAISGPGGRTTDISDGKIKDGEVSFAVVRERNGQKFTTKYQGKVDGNTIKGTSERDVNGTPTKRDWEAKRK